MAFVDDLLEQAASLAIAEAAGRPKQASLRRAVSAAYYALFHEITSLAVVHVLGGLDAEGPIGGRVRRVVRHVAVKGAAKWFSPTPHGTLAMPDGIADMRGGRRTMPSADLGSVCESLVELQEARHRADYDLLSPLNRAEVVRLVEISKQAVLRLRGLPSSVDRTVFLSEVCT